MFVNRRFRPAYTEAQLREAVAESFSWAESLRRLGLRDAGGNFRTIQLRIVCPNCAATLETHCGRNKPIRSPDACEHCGETFYPSTPTQRYCSRACGSHDPGPPGPRLDRRKVDRPPYDVLIAELAASNYSAVGRKYGVSDNAVRKWVRWHEQERSDEAA